MKNSNLYFSAVAALLLFSCGQSNQSDSAQIDSLSKAADTVLSTACYTAKDQSDSASLSLHTAGDGKVTGKLLINYSEKGKNEGEIEGTFRGDTLFVDYTFKIGNTNETIYKNPLALLKKDGKLILGVGQIETTMGRSYFVKGKPINFDKGRFIFSPAECGN